MGNRARTLVLAGALGWALAACGDPLVIIGDAPGLMRIVAGIPDSAGSQLAAEATASLLFSPQGVAADQDGMLYVADRGNARILAVDAAGAVEQIAGAAGAGSGPSLSEPQGLALDGAGRLLIADPGAQRVWQLDLTSLELVALAGSGVKGTAPDTVLDATTADLESPTGVAVGPAGRVYFSEATGHRIRRIDSDGRMVTVAGSGIPGLAGDGGPATLARLARPTDLALTGETLYITDTGNHSVRVVDLAASTITTLAGSGVRGFAGDEGPADEARLDTPQGLALRPDGRVLFIADTNNHRLRSVDLGTRTINTFAGTGAEAFNGDLLEAGATGLSLPGGMDVSTLGFLFLADTGHHIVRRVAVRFVTGS